jgi:hypothetical protein
MNNFMIKDGIDLKELSIICQHNTLVEENSPVLLLGVPFVFDGKS